jgi:hypothetical protein
MSVSNEQKCMLKVREFELKFARKSLANFAKTCGEFEFPFAGIEGFIWEKTLSGKTRQILLLPVAFVLILFLILLTPIAYILHLKHVIHKKSEINKNIKRLEAEPLPSKFPDEKTIYNIWRLHELDTHVYYLHDRLDLLCDLVDILYGEGVSQKLMLSDRAGKIQQNHNNANTPYYQGKSAPFYIFKDTVDVLVEELAEELLPYDSKLTMFKNYSL